MRILRIVLIIAIVLVSAFGVYQQRVRDDTFVEGLHNPYTGQQYATFDDIPAVRQAYVLIIFAYYADDAMCEEVAIQVTEVAKHIQDNYPGVAVVITSGVNEGNRTIRNYAKKHNWPDLGVVTIGGIPANDKTNVPMLAGLLREPPEVFYLVQSTSFDAQEVCDVMDFMVGMFALRYRYEYDQRPEEKQQQP